jgi:cysteine dioxygenase
MLIKHLIDKLRFIPQTRISETLLSYSFSNSGDWRRYIKFNDEHYTRNLIYKEKDFELLLLCWKKGQESPLHYHDQKACWLTILDGQLKETRLRKDSVLYKNTVHYIDDSIGPHRVYCPENKAISLHLYKTIN